MLPKMKQACKTIIPIKLNLNKVTVRTKVNCTRILELVLHQMSSHIESDMYVGVHKNRFAPLHKLIDKSNIPPAEQHVIGNKIVSNNGNRSTIDTKKVSVDSCERHNTNAKTDTLSAGHLDSCIICEYNDRNEQDKYELNLRFQAKHKHNIAEARHCKTF